MGIAAHAQSAGQGWEKAAGGKQEFDVASVRADKNGGRSYSNLDLDGGSNAYWVMNKSDVAATEGSLFSAKNQPLMRYIIFAYRLNGTQELALRFDYYGGLGLHVPEWVRNSGYDIEARAPGPATKDQMRLMMQGLLADRFKLQAHWETREAPVFALVEAKPESWGCNWSSIRRATIVRRRICLTQRARRRMRRRCFPLCPSSAAGLLICRRARPAPIGLADAT